MKPHEVLDECQRRAYATLEKLDEDLHPSTRNSVIDKVGEAVRNLTMAAQQLRRAEGAADPSTPDREMRRTRQEDDEDARAWFDATEHVEGHVDRSEMPAW